MEEFQESYLMGFLTSSAMMFGHVCSGYLFIKLYQGVLLMNKTTLKTCLKELREFDDF